MKIRVVDKTSRSDPAVCTDFYQNARRDFTAIIDHRTRPNCDQRLLLARLEEKGRKIASPHFISQYYLSANDN